MNKQVKKSSPTKIIKHTFHHHIHIIIFSFILYFLYLNKMFTPSKSFKNNLKIKFIVNLYCDKQ